MEYPKALYLDGDASKDMKMVHDAEQEKAARAEGYKMIYEPVKEVKKK